MKRLQKITVILFTCGLFLTTVFTDVTYAKSKGTIKNIKVTNVKNKKLKLQVGQSKSLKTKVVIKGNISKKLIFRSSNKKIATVSKKGKIKAKKIGNAKIIITSKANKKKKVTIKVNVVKKSALIQPTIKPDAQKPNVDNIQKPTTKPSIGNDTTTKVPMLNKEDSGSGDSTDLSDMFGK